jgi:hypothetical protein
MSKYILAYALIALVIGLGSFIVCRPGRRVDPD